MSDAISNPMGFILILKNGDLTSNLVLADVAEVLERAFRRVADEMEEITRAEVIAAAEGMQDVNQSSRTDPNRRVGCSGLRACVMFPYNCRSDDGGSRL